MKNNHRISTTTRTLEKWQVCGCFGHITIILDHIKMIKLHAIFRGYVFFMKI